MFKIKDEQLIWKPTKELPDLKYSKKIAIDVETKDQNIRTLGPGGYRGKDGYICGICIATDDGWSGYIPINHPLDEQRPIKNFNKKDVQKWFSQNLTRSHQIKVGANIMYDLEWLDVEGFPVNDSNVQDIQIAEPLIYEYHKRYNLDSIAKRYLPEIYWKLGDDLKEDTEDYLNITLGEKEDARSYIYKLPTNIVGPYGEMDVVAPLKILEKQQKIIDQKKLNEIYSIECRLLPLVLRMRKRGVRIAIDKIDSLKEEMENELEKLLAKMYKIAGQEFNIKSGDQIGLVYDKLGISYNLTQKTGKPSITTSWLSQQNDDISKNILKARSYRTAINTFIEGNLLKHLVKDRIHCQFNTLKGDKYGTVSGRFSASNPNPQQIPSREESFADKIRSLFIPDENQTWWKIDWSQIEYRFMVHYAYVKKFQGASKIRNMFYENPSTDFHQIVADLCGIERKPAKNINFGIAYGMGKKSLKNKLGVSESQAEEIISDYHKIMGFMTDLSQSVMKTAERRGFIRTIKGRIRHFDLWEPPQNYKNSDNHKEPLHREAALKEFGTNIRRAKTYTALNALIQGSAADLMKMAMVESFESGLFDADNLGIPELTVHDELCGSSLMDKRRKECLRELAHIMNTCITLEVPIVSEPEIGLNWWETKKLSER